MPKPLIMTGPSIPAILSGDKTQTRRLLKPQPHPDIKYFHLLSSGLWKPVWKSTAGEHFQEDNECLKLPHKPGDVVPIKEEWRVGAWDEDLGKIAVDYADGTCRRELLAVPDPDQFERLWIQSSEDAAKVYGRQERFEWQPGESPCRWRSPLFMPNWAVRIWIEITGIWPERLQEITEEDVFKDTPWNRHEPFPRRKFNFDWDQMHSGHNATVRNPWVIVREFRLKEV